MGGTHRVGLDGGVRYGERRPWAWKDYLEISVKTE